MAYSYKNSKGDTYFLHSRITGKNGTGRLFYFAKEAKDNTVEKLPTGYQVIENQRTGMPIIKKAE
jgi:hypothetical protein